MNAVYCKNMENLRNRIDVRLVSNKGDYLKWPSKTSYMCQNILDNDLVAIRKSKVTLKLAPRHFVINITFRNNCCVF